MVSVIYGTGVQLFGSDFEGSEVNDLITVPMILRADARNILGANIPDVVRVARLLSVPKS
jgi:hypothetical protein